MTFNLAGASSLSFGSGPLMLILPALPRSVHRDSYPVCVDSYIGGVEHAVLRLPPAMFWHAVRPSPGRRRSLNCWPGNPGWPLTQNMTSLVIVPGQIVGIVVR
jgi:hypothetical protein